MSKIYMKIVYKSRKSDNLTEKWARDLKRYLTKEYEKKCSTTLTIMWMHSLKQCTLIYTHLNSYEKKTGKAKYW